MTKTLAFRLNKNTPVKLSFSYPDFKKEGFAALFPIFDWLSYLTISAFFILAFLVDSGDIYKLIYCSGTILFAVQIMRGLLGGLTVFPKTVLDIGGLLFVALIIISILFSSSQSNSLFGEGKLSFLSGINTFVLLIIYYLTVSQTIFAKSGSFLKILLFVSFTALGLTLLGRQEVILEKEISFAYYLPLAIPFVFFKFLSSEKLINTIASAGLLVLLLCLTNFNDFAFSFSLSTSILIAFFILIIWGSGYLYEAVNKLFLGISSLLKGKPRVLELIQNNGKFLIGLIGSFALFIFSITKSVENYSEDFSRVGEVFTKAIEDFGGFTIWLFGVGLGTHIGSFYADILGSYGVLGLAGFSVLVCLSIYYIFKMLQKFYKEKDYAESGIILGTFISFLSLLIYFVFESITVYGYILFWLLVTFIGAYATNTLYKQTVQLNSLVQPNSIKLRKLVALVRPAALSIVAIVAIISVYLIAQG